MYNYAMYGYNILSNCELPYLTVSEYDPEIPEIQLNINCIPGFINNKGVGVTRNECYYSIAYTDLVYFIYPKEYKISVITKSVDRVARTIGNVPMSVLAMSHNYFLLHCSSVLINNQLYAFMGDKGAGKSTIAYKLIRLKGAIPFSDDAVLFTLRGVYSRGNIYKVFRKDYIDNAPFFEKFTPYFFDEITEKVYLEYDNNRQIQNFLPHINTIFWLQRSTERNYRQESIDDKNTKRIMILNNLVGCKKLSKYFTLYILNNLIETIVSETKMEILHVPIEKYEDAMVLGVKFE